MKYSKLTYYLLAILCLMATSCVSDGVMDGCPDNNKQELVNDARVNLILSFAITSTRSITSEGVEKERNIKDIHIYAFQQDHFIEEVKYILISGSNGDATRRIEGRLSATYDSSQGLELVVVANAEDKGVNSIDLTKVNNKNDLYQQLVFNYDGSEVWQENIPMSGVCNIDKIKEGYNTGELTLTRAVAKVNVTVNEGHGIDNFQINEIKLCNYNTKGYCTSSKIDEPNILNGTTQSKSPISSGTLTEIEGNAYENHFYIPEHQNVGVNKEQKVYLEINATVKGIAKNYTLAFTQNDNPHNVLRNYLYVFNIRSVKMEVNVEPTLEYEVKVWEEETVDIPSFN